MLRFRRKECTFHEECWAWACATDDSTNSRHPPIVMGTVEPRAATSDHVCVLSASLEYPVKTFEVGDFDHTFHHALCSDYS